MTSGKRQEVDWQSVERDYRAGVLSLREMGEAHSVSHVSIKKHADKAGWTRDLSAKIRAKADDLVNRAQANRAGNTKAAVSERQIVEANAERIAQVRGEHRADITRMRSLVLTLLGECEMESAAPAVFAKLGELLRNPDDKGMDRLNDAYQKAVSLPQRIKGVKELADTLKVLVGLEREAYGLASTDDQPQPLADALAGFVAQIHQAGAGRLQFKPRGQN